jgi:hypothetical protein
MPKSARSYQRDIVRLQLMIADMLWVQPTYNGSPSCSFCGEQEHLHAKHCEATRLVAKKWPESDLRRQYAVKEG